MRVSTGMIFQRGLESMQKQQSNLFETQQHISANKRVIRPSDDPVAASRAVETTQAKALNNQYGENQAVARDALALAESTLGNIGDVLQDARVLLLNAGSGSLGDNDRKSLALDLKGKLDQLIGLANTRDGAGAYLFGGFQSQVQPFTPTPTGAKYNEEGDQGRRELQVGPGRTIAVSENGAELFERLREGNGTFSIDAVDTNTGTASSSVGRATGAVTPPIDYDITFTVVGDVTTYVVTNNTTGVAEPAANYVSGAVIEVNVGGGATLDFEIAGEPANGDSFAIAPAERKNVFAMLSEAINTLEQPLTDGAARARFTEDMGRALQNVDNAFDRVLTVRTSMGASLRELDALSSVVQDNTLHYEERLSELVDLDYAAALTQLVRQQTALEAAQLSYQRVTSLSLFNYL